MLSVENMNSFSEMTISDHNSHVVEALDGQPDGDSYSGCLDESSECSNYCRYCDLSFEDEDELNNHCETPEHELCYYQAIYSSNRRHLIQDKKHMKITIKMDPSDPDFEEGTPDYVEEDKNGKIIIQIEKNTGSVSAPIYVKNLSDQSMDLLSAVKLYDCDRIQVSDEYDCIEQEKIARIPPGISANTFYARSSNHPRIVTQLQAAADSDGDDDYDSDDSVADPDFFLDNPNECQEMGDEENEEYFADEEFPDGANAAGRTEEDSNFTQGGTDAVIIEINDRASRAARRQSVASWVLSTAEDSTEIPSFISEDCERDATLGYPIDYVRQFLTQDFLELVVEQSNQYSAWKDPNKLLNTTLPEIEQWIGLVYYFSMVKISNARNHWNGQFPGLRDVVSGIMSRDRWFEIKSNLHFVDNAVPSEDKFCKVRPMISHLQDKFRQIPKIQNLCVDEQLVPFKGKSSLKQYLPSKPHKWGYKIFVLADEEGVTYDFIPYAGKISPVENTDVPDLKASGNIVLHLAQSIPSDRNHLLFFDNWFSSIPLMQFLMTKNIFCCGTVRQNRIPGFKSNKVTDKELMKKGRGSFEERRLVSEECDISYVRWFDNKIVNMLSTFARAEPVKEVERFDKKAKKKIQVKCPDIIKIYNRSMGGVDKADFLIALYRIDLRSKKYYLKLVFHMFDMIIVNSWLLYKRDARDLKIPKREVLPLASFKLKVAFALMQEGKVLNLNRRGRPSSSDQERRKHFKGAAPHPDAPVRYDQVGHWPVVDEVRRLCRLEGCKGRTNITCSKCKLHLCLNGNINHFLSYHNK